MVFTRFATTAFVLLISASSAFGTEAQNVFTTRVHVWARAFIPDHDPGAPDEIFSTSKGTKVIKAPAFFGLTKPACFEGDNRWFDAAPSASSRIGLDFTLLINGRDMSVVHEDGGDGRVVFPSRKVDCVTGELLMSPKSAPKEPLIIHDIVKSSFQRALFIEAAGANPFYPSVKVPGLNMYLGVSPDIDFKLSFLYRFLTRDIFVTGTVGYFPAFEAYYSINSGPAMTLYNLPPYEDSTPWSLVDFGSGLNTRNVSTILKLKQN
jgi:hypothetical protein